MVQEYSLEILVNGIALEFCLIDQNQFLLKNKENGELTPQG
jgi:hypothetical protein